MTTAGAVILPNLLHAAAKTPNKQTQILPPEALNPKSKQVRLNNGVTLYYVEKQNRNQDQDVIIFLHGYTDSWHSFERNLPL